jgi:hypothetical protein
MTFSFKWSFQAWSSEPREQSSHCELSGTNSELGVRGRGPCHDRNWSAETVALDDFYTTALLGVRLGAASPFPCI